MSTSNARRKLSMSYRRRQTREFLIYLDDNNLKDHIHTKDQLKRVYDSQFKEYKSASSKELVAYFGSLWHILRIDGYVQTDGTAVKFKGQRSDASQGQGQGRDSRSSASPEQSSRRTKGQGSSGATTVTSADASNARSEVTSGSNEVKARSSRRRGRHRRVELAVDQHLIGVDQILQQLGPRDSASSLEDSSNGSPVQAPLPAGVQKQGHQYSCAICQATCSSRHELDKHTSGKRHRVQSLIYALKEKKGELIRNKSDVIVTSANDSEDGTMRVDLLENKSVTMEIVIENDGDSELVLRHCEMLKRLRVFTLDDQSKVTEGSKTHSLKPGEKYKVSVVAKARHIGRYTTPLAMMFTRGDNPSHKIHFVRFLIARCNNALIHELQPTSPYKHPPRKTFNRGGPVTVVEGLPLDSQHSSQLERVIELETYTVPTALRHIMNRGLKEQTNMSEEDRQELTIVKDLLHSPLGVSNHYNKFSLLLHIEEIQMEVDIRKYDLEAVTMLKSRERSRLLALKVPGLAENRPSVLRGDWLFVRVNHADGKLEDQEFKGYVHEIHIDQVLLGFSDKLLSRFLPNMKFNVRFVFNRLPLRLQHRAAQLSEEHTLDKLLFPTATSVCQSGTIQPVDAPLVVYDRQLESNREQMTAVRHILAGTSRPAPYLLFGPPGTGKTVTIVEAMKQVLKCLPSSRILACAPSNSAVDLLTERLLKHVAKAEVFRICASSRPYDTVPDVVQGVCNYDKRERRYYYPSKADLLKYRIIVCTLVTAGRLVSANFPAGHFSHIFIDEAGHAVEPEALIAVAGILESDVQLADGGQVVLAGDPEQLGPVLRSPISSPSGLNMSLLERYMKTVDVYKRRESAVSPTEAYDRRLLTKLVRNYRSHPAILKLPNELFYNKELEPHADQLLRESLCQWEHLPKKNFPVVFHSVIGEDLREERSPSFFNPEEVSMVLQYIEQLLSARARGVKVIQKDISIISPYRKQVQKIRMVLKKKNYNDIKVGSVEEFQGQESRVIIISTVRSKSEFLALDAEFKLGFLRNPKRFNVAVTRAKALLVVIGNPLVLSKDDNWRKFIEYVKTSGGFVGADFDLEETDVMDDIIQRFSAVKLDDLADVTEPGSDLVELQVSAVEQAEQPEWRGED